MKEECDSAGCKSRVVAWMCEEHENQHWKSAIDNGFQSGAQTVLTAIRREANRLFGEHEDAQAKSLRDLADRITEQLKGRLS